MNVLVMSYVGNFVSVVEVLVVVVHVVISHGYYFFVCYFLFVHDFLPYIKLVGVIIAMVYI